MEIIRGNLSDIKGIPPSGLCVSVTAPARCIRRWSPSMATVGGLVA